MALSGLRTTRAARKPFYVDAVRVTAGNMPAIAEWCGGVIYATTPEEGLKRYVKVPVEGAKNDRQTKAYLGDWVLKATANSFKVYTNKSYLNSFDEVGDLSCGDPTMTLDHQPCVLNHKHKFAAVPVGCRSFDDYVELEKRVVDPPATALDSDMGPALSEACA